MVATATLESGSYYAYVPFLMAASGFAAVFLQTTALHTYQVARSKTKFFIPVIVGGLLEAIEYACRLISHFESPTFSVIPFAIQYTCILVAPTVIAAAVYMYYEYIIFLIGDCFSFLIQSVGSILRLTTSVSNIRLGNRLVMMGLGEQMILLTIFVFTAAKSQYNISRKSTARLSGDSESKFAHVNINYKKHLIALYVAAALIAIRSAVRLGENLQGTTGLIRNHEIFLYIFDAGLMLNLMMLFHYVHPSQIDAWQAFYSTEGADAQRVFFDGWKVLQGKRLVSANMMSV